MPLASAALQERDDATIEVATEGGAGRNVARAGEFRSGCPGFGAVRGTTGAVVEADCGWHQHLGRYDFRIARADRGKLMLNAFGILIGITLVVAIVALLDWFGRRKERQSR